MNGSHDATFYVQVDPEFTSSGNVWNLHAVRMTQRKPSQQLGGTVLVKLTLRIPDAAFLPLRPEAVVIVPESMTSAEPIVVAVEDANAVTA